MFIREEIHFNYSRAISASENNLESLDLAENPKLIRLMVMNLKCTVWLFRRLKCIAEVFNTSKAKS